jgi:hypothetical protein
MDAYDYIAEEAALGAEVNEKGKDKAEGPEKETLNTEFQQAYKVISSSPWGARFGAFVGNVRKQVSLGATGLWENVLKIDARVNRIMSPQGRSIPQSRNKLRRA